MCMHHVSSLSSLVIDFLTSIIIHYTFLIVKSTAYRPVFFSWIDNHLSLRHVRAISAHSRTNTQHNSVKCEFNKQFVLVCYPKWPKTFWCSLIVSYSVLTGLHVYTGTQSSGKSTLESGHRKSTEFNHLKLNFSFSPFCLPLERH